MNNNFRLSEKSQWEDRWSKAAKVDLSFDPEKSLFRDTHQILQKYLRPDTNSKFLEVGAYPGKYLWYFYNYFGYEPWGIEYVESCAEQAQEMLQRHQVPAKMIVDDFFNLKVEDHADGNGWDLVASFGFVEHFDSSEVVVAKHLEVARPGGLIVVSVPNHAGWNGRLLRYVDKDKWSQHNHMSLADLLEAFAKSGGNTVLFSGYAGHLGFWNVGLYSRLKAILGRFYPVARGPLWLVEKVGQWLVPNNKLTSPEILVVARKE